MNERCLLAVVVPRMTPEVLSAFVARVANLLSMIGIPDRRIEEELEHFTEGRYGKTASRRLLGVLNDLTFRLQDALERLEGDNKLSLSDFEKELAEMPHATLQWLTPREVARSLLSSPASHGAA